MTGEVGAASPGPPAAADGAAALAAFREAVFDDFNLMLWLRTPYDRDAYVAKVVAVGAKQGFRFGAADVWVALRKGERAWLDQGVEVAE